MADQWEKDIWSKQLGSKITEELESRDWSACYEMDAAHLFKTEDGRFVVVTESGCSCYDSSDADLREYPTESEARTKFNEYVKENGQ